MSLTDQLDEINQIKHKKPVKCVFCIDRDLVGEHGLWNFSKPSDKIIQDFFKSMGISKCNHKEGIISIEMSEFVARILCNYVLKHHIHMQNDSEFIEGISRDKELMAQLMEKDLKEKLSFDQSRFDEKTAKWLAEKYARFKDYQHLLMETVYA